MTVRLYLTYDNNGTDAKFTVYGDKANLLDLLSVVQRNRLCSNVGLVEDKKEDKEPF